MISIIVPIYNAAKYLPACLESLSSQTERDLQIILVDDGSTDDCWIIAKTYTLKDRRFEFIQQKHAGQSAARNNGLKHAKGEFIAFVDADDTIEPDWCERHLKAIDDVEYVQSGDPKNKYQFTAVWNRLYRRQAIEGLQFTEGMIYEDVVWSVDLWLRGLSCRMIPYTGYHYTCNPNSTTSRPHPEAQKKVLRMILQRAKGASLKGKLIAYYTYIRLSLYFIASGNR